MLFILKEANVVYDKQIGQSSKFTAMRSSISWINSVIEHGVNHELLKTIDGMYKALNQIVGNVNDASLKQIAYMNLNKRGGAGTATVQRSLNAYVSRYSDYIRKEIEIINPDFVVCCGSGVIGMVFEVIRGEKGSVDYFNMGRTIYVKARHPSYSYMSTQQKIDEFEQYFLLAYRSLKQ